MSKRAEERAIERYPHDSKEYKTAFGTFYFDDTFAAHREGFVVGYEQAEKDLARWIPVEEALPEIDEEVIVLIDELGTAPIYKIGFGHIVDKNIAVDYNGWNTPGVKFWMPCPKIPEE